MHIRANIAPGLFIGQPVILPARLLLHKRESIRYQQLRTGLLGFTLAQKHASGFAVSIKPFALAILLPPSCKQGGKLCESASGYSRASCSVLRYRAISTPPQSLNPLRLSHLRCMDRPYNTLPGPVQAVFSGYGVEGGA